MLRSLVCGLVALALVAGPATAAPKAKKGKKVGGAFASYTAGTLSIKVKGKKGEEPKLQAFKVADDTKVVTIAGEEKKVGTAKDSLKDVKVGTHVVVSLGEGDMVTAVQVGKAAKKKPAKKTEKNTEKK